MVKLGDISLVQADGSMPATLATGSSPGEWGVSIYKWRFRAGAHFRGTSPQHHIWFASPARFHCRIAGQNLSHNMPTGSLAIGPAGIDCDADAEGNFDSLLVAIDPLKLTLAAADDSTYDPRPVVRLLSNDQTLAGLACQLAEEISRGFPNGPLFWNEIVGRFIADLLLRHTAEPPPATRGQLGKDVLHRMRDYVAANLDEPIAVATLAQMAGRSPFHFSRLFSRSVGVTPHRYIVHLRLQRAAELIRNGGLSFAEIAAQTGFADQSHLSRWVRRVYGAPLTQVAGRRKRDESRTFGRDTD
jgi:AraC family transcriptional regulator